MRPSDYLTLAAHAAGPRDQRTYRIGAVAVRRDGAVVSARNGSAERRTPEIHAEARISRKLDLFATVYVARVSAADNWALARPCPDCMRTLARKSATVYWTVGPGEYHCLALPTSSTRLQA